MAERKGNQRFNVCDTCGAIGFLKELVICCGCKSIFRHSYCMDDMYSDLTTPWHCNDCPPSLKVDQEQKEIMLGNKDFDAEDNDRMKTSLQLGNEDQDLTNKLTSKVVNSANDKQGDMGVSGTTRPANNKVANASAYSASLSKDPGTALPQKMVPLPNPKYSKEKSANCHDEPCWKGTFEILDGNFLLPPYQGLRAHLSCDVNPKVVNLCKTLSEKLEFKELPFSKVWPKIFMLEPPNTDDVALYFFCDIGRSREKYIRLVQRLDSRDHALRAKMKGAQLLLFSSKKLPPDPQKTKHISYLWGIIRFPKPKGILKNTTVKSTNSTPKTKKKISFELSNLPEKRYVDVNINAKNNGPKSCLAKEPCLNQSESIDKSVAEVNSLGEQEKETGIVSVRVDTKCYKVKDKVDYHTNEVDPDLPPGFSNFVPSKQQMNVQLQTASKKGDVLKNKVTNISPDPDIPPGFYCSAAFNNLTYEDVQLRMDCDKGKIVKNNGIINKLTNVCVDPDIPPGFSYPLSAFVKSSSANTANNHTDQGLPGFSFLPTNDIRIEKSLPLLLEPKKADMSLENSNIQMENSDMSIDSEDEGIEESSMPDPFNSSSTKKDFLIPNIGPPPGFPEIPIKLAKCIVGVEFAVKRHFVLPTECCECLQGVKDGTCAVKSDVKVVKPNSVQSPLSKDATSTMIKCQNAPIVCAKAPDSENKPGENPNNQSPISSADKENSFISPNSAEECNKFKFTLEHGCKSYDNNLSWMNKTMKVAVPDDAENGTFRSNVKAQSENSGKTSGKNTFGVKFSLKKADKPDAPGVPIWFKNPSNVDSQITPKSFQKTDVSESYDGGSFWHAKGKHATRDKQETEEKSSSRSSRPPTEQFFKNHYINKNPALTLPASSAEKARDVSSRTTNPESVSEVRRILLEVKKSRELKGKK